MINYGKFAGRIIEKRGTYQVLQKPFQRAYSCENILYAFMIKTGTYFLYQANEKTLKFRSKTCTIFIIADAIFFLNGYTCIF